MSIKLRKVGIIGEYEDLADCDIIVLSAGKTCESRNMLQSLV